MDTLYQTDDYAPDSSTTGILAPGLTLSGSTDNWLENDWFKAELTAGTTYHFKLDPFGMYGYNGQQSSTRLVLRDAQGAELASSYGDSLYVPSYVQYTPTVSGAYYLDVELIARVGKYKVSMEIPVPDAVPSQGAGAPLVEAGVKVEGVFDYAGDRDWYRFHAEQGQHLKFGTPKGSAADAVFATDYAFYTLDGKPLDYMYPFEPMVSGDYYVSLQGDEKGSYTLLMTALADDYAGNAATTGQLQPGGPAVSGKIDYAYDRDAFRVPVEAGKMYTVRVSGISTSLYGLQYRAADAATGTTYAISKVDGGFSFKAGSTGDALLSLTSFASPLPATGGNYVLELVAGVPDDHGDNVAHATAVALGQTVNAELQGGGDTDVFKVELQGGVTYDLEAVGTLQTSLRLTDATGMEIASRGNTNPPLPLSVTPAASGSYFAHVSGPGSTYSFKAVAIQDDYAANTGNPGLLLVGGSAKGTIDNYADADWLAIDLAEGVTYWFEGPGSARVVDGQGKTLAEMPTGLRSDQTPVMPFVPEKSGTYYVSVRGGPGSYTVKAQLGERDDFGATRSTAGKLVADVQAKGRLELPQDSDMYHFSASAGTSYVVELTDSQGYVVRDGYQVHVQSDLGSAGLMRKVERANVSVTMFEPQASGDYYFTVNGDGGSKGDYGLRLRPVAGDLVPANRNTTAELHAGQPIHSALETRYDGDWYKVAVQKDRAYVVELLGAFSGNGTLNAQSANLSVTNERGYTTNFEGSYAYRPYSEPLATFKADQDGAYYVGVDGNTVASGGYMLKVTDITNDRKGPALATTSFNANVHADLYDTQVFVFDERIKVDERGVTLNGPNGTIGLSSFNGTHDGLLSAGNKLFINPAARLDPGITYTIELKPGSITDVAGNPYSGALSFSFSTKPLLQTGTAGDDYLDGAAKSTQMAGGAGLDTVLYAGSVNGYTINGSGAGKFTIGPRLGAFEPTVTLDGIERLVFGQSTSVALDIEGTGGQAYRLYQAAFNRTPDAGGVGYWMAQMDKGMVLTDVARSFVASAEFQKLYGANPTDAAFVDMLYNNVLHRAPDAAGAAYWNGALRDGLPREQALAYFSEGKENHDAVAKLIANGFSYTPYG